METLTIVLIIVCVVLLAAGIFLAVKYFKGLTDEQRTMFINACTKAVKTILAALADGKITAAELLQIAQALIAVIAAFAGKPASDVAEELGATEYINTVSENEEIIIEDKTMIKDTTYEERVEEYEENLKKLKASDIYASDKFNRMVQIYNEKNTSGKVDGELARLAAMEVLTLKGYNQLTPYDRSALLSNITHGKIDTA